MARVSNVLIGVVNIVILLLSASLIGASIYFRSHGGSDCQKVLQTPLLATGIIFLAVSIIGLVGACCKVRFAMCLYSFVMFVVMVGLVAFTVFAMVVTNKGVGSVVSNRGYKEYRLGDYSNWLQKYVVNDKNWDEIRSCLVGTHVCTNIVHDLNTNKTNVLKASDFYKINLSSIQSGCCKPPTSCGFEYKNATLWDAPDSGPASADSDCKTWNNSQTTLCYDCNSCKGGVLANIKKEWKHLAIVNSCLFVIVMICYSIACCAYKNNKSDHKEANIRGRV